MLLSIAQIKANLIGLVEVGLLIGLLSGMFGAGGAFSEEQVTGIVIS